MHGKTGTWVDVGLTIVTGCGGGGCISGRWDFYRFGLEEQQFLTSRTDDGVGGVIIGRVIYWPRPR